MTYLLGCICQTKAHPFISKCMRETKTFDREPLIKILISLKSLLLMTHALVFFHPDHYDVGQVT